MSYVGILGYLKTLLLGVSGIGVVHDYERWAAQWADLLTLYKSGGHLNGWAVTRRRTAAEWLENPLVRRNHTFEITGIYSLDDSAATEKTFQGIIENIDAAIRFDYNLGGNCLVAGPLQIEEIDARMFGGVLCHYGLLIVPVTEREYDS